MHEATGMGKLVNASLLLLINEACMNVCSLESTRRPRLCALTAKIINGDITLEVR